MATNFFSEYKLIICQEKCKHASCLYQGKNVYCSSLRNLFYIKSFFFIYFLERQVHKKESKLEIMTMWVKGIFSNIRNVKNVLVMNDLLHNIWENFLIKFISLRKIGGEVEAPFTQLPRKKTLRPRLNCSAPQPTF